MVTDKIQVAVENPAVTALNRIADALERLADVYLYVNDPDGEEGDRPESLTLPSDFKGMR